MNAICPVCHKPLVSARGTQLNPDDGITVWCPNPDCKTDEGFDCQEVAGHGATESQALNVIKEKYEAHL